MAQQMYHLPRLSYSYSNSVRMSSLRHGKSFARTYARPGSTWQVSAVITSMNRAVDGRYMSTLNQNDGDVQDNSQTIEPYLASERTPTSTSRSMFTDYQFDIYSDHPYPIFFFDPNGPYYAALMRGIKASAEVLESWHSLTSLPWAASIVTGVIGLRMLLIPATVYSIRNAARATLAKDDIKSILSEYQNAAMRLGPYAGATERMELLRATISGVRASLHKVNCKPWRSFVLPILHWPLIFTGMLGARHLVLLGDESFEDGGFLWFQDLTVADPTYALPLIAYTSTYALLEIAYGEGWKSSSNENNPNKSMEPANQGPVGAASLLGSNLLKFVRNMAQLWVIATIPFTYQFPAGLYLAWITGSVYGIGWISLVRSPAFRAFVTNTPNNDRKSLSDDDLFDIQVTASEACDAEPIQAADSNKQAQRTSKLNTHPSREAQIPDMTSKRMFSSAAGDDDGAFDASSGSALPRPRTCRPGRFDLRRALREAHAAELIRQCEAHTSNLLRLRSESPPSLIEYPLPAASLERVAEENERLFSILESLEASGNTQTVWRLSSCTHFPAQAHQSLLSQTARPINSYSARRLNRKSDLSERLSSDVRSNESDSNDTDDDSSRNGSTGDSGDMVGQARQTQPRSVWRVRQEPSITFRTQFMHDRWLSRFGDRFEANINDSELRDRPGRYTSPIRTKMSKEEAYEVVNSCFEVLHNQDESTARKYTADQIASALFALCDTPPPLNAKRCLDSFYRLSKIEHSPEQISEQLQQTLHAFFRDIDAVMAAMLQFSRLRRALLDDAADLSTTDNVSYSHRRSLERVAQALNLVSSHFNREMPLATSISAQAREFLNTKDPSALTFSPHSIPARQSYRGSRFYSWSKRLDRLPIVWGSDHRQHISEEDLSTPNFDDGFIAAVGSGVTVYSANLKQGAIPTQVGSLPGITHGEEELAFAHSMKSTQRLESELTTLLSVFDSTYGKMQQFATPLRLSSATKHSALHPRSNGNQIAHKNTDQSLIRSDNLHQVSSSPSTSLFDSMRTRLSRMWHSFTSATLLTSKQPTTTASATQASSSGSAQYENHQAQPDSESKPQEQTEMPTKKPKSVSELLSYWVRDSSSHPAHIESTSSYEIETDVPSDLFSEDEPAVMSLNASISDQISEISNSDDIEDHAADSAFRAIHQTVALNRDISRSEQDQIQLSRKVSAQVMPFVRSGALPVAVMPLSFDLQQRMEEATDQRNVEHGPDMLAQLREWIQQDEEEDKKNTLEPRSHHMPFSN